MCPAHLPGTSADSSMTPILYALVLSNRARSSSASSGNGTPVVRYPDDPTIVGRVTAVAMRIAEGRDNSAKAVPLT